MSKFCGNCGSYLDDDALVCGVCGTPYSDDGIGKTKIPGVDTMNPKTKKEDKTNFQAKCSGCCFGGGFCYCCEYNIFVYRI